MFLESEKSDIFGIQMLATPKLGFDIKYIYWDTWYHRTNIFVLIKCELNRALGD